MSDPTARTPLPYARLSAFYLVYYAGIGAFSPYFGLWLDRRGLSASAISIVMSLWYGLRIVAPSAWSHLTQRSAKPIIWLRVATLTTVGCFAGFLLPLGYAGILAVMVAFAFFYNAAMPQFESITLSHLRDRASFYGRIRVWGSVGFIGIVSAYGWVFDHVDIAHLPLMMLPIFAVLALVSFGNEYGPSRIDASAKRGETLLESVRRPGVAAFLAMALLMQVAHGAFYVFFSLFLADHGYRASAVGAFWAVGLVAEIAMFWFAGNVMRRVSTVGIMRFCLAVAALRFVATGTFPESVAIVACAQLTHALTFGLFHAACMQRMTELFPPQLVGQGQGLLYGVSSGFGGVVGALLAGAAWKFGGGDAAFVACGIAAAAGLLVPIRRSRPETR